MNKFVTPGKVRLINATILAPENAGLRFILNVGNQDGTFGSKLDGVLAKKWSKVRETFKEWHATQQNFKLGSVNHTAVGSDTWVVTMLIKDKAGKVDSTVLDKAVKNLASLAKYEKASLHVSTLLMEDYPVLRDLLTKHLVEEGVNVYYYEEPTK